MHAMHTSSVMDFSNGKKHSYVNSVDYSSFDVLNWSTYSNFGTKSSIS